MVFHENDGGLFGRFRHGPGRFQRAGRSVRGQRAVSQEDIRFRIDAGGGNLSGKQEGIAVRGVGMDAGIDCLLYTSNSTMKREFSPSPKIKLWTIEKAVSYTHLDVYKRQGRGYVRYFKNGALLTDTEGRVLETLTPWKTDEQVSNLKEIINPDKCRKVPAFANGFGYRYRVK